MKLFYFILFTISRVTFKEALLLQESARFRKVKYLQRRTESTHFCRCPISTGEIRQPLLYSLGSLEKRRSLKEISHTKIYPAEPQKLYNINGDTIIPLALYLPLLSFSQNLWTTTQLRRFYRKQYSCCRCFGREGLGWQQDHANYSDGFDFQSVLRSLVLSWFM